MTPRRLTCTEDFMLLIEERRKEMGLTHGDLDHRVGWQDAYASKVEGGDRPWGKRPFNMTANARDVLEALDLVLVAMPADEAAKMADPEATRIIKQIPRGGKVARKTTRQTWIVKRNQT